jgi:tRNA G10  N-methylase Trm11
MPLFSSLGRLRHLQGYVLLREFVQTLYHLTDEEKLPLARSTAADALSSKRRQKDLESALEKLYKKACKSIHDRLKEISGLNGRQVFAVDGTYQKKCSF